MTNVKFVCIDINAGAVCLKQVLQFGHFNQRAQTCLHCFLLCKIWISWKMKSEDVFSLAFTRIDDFLCCFFSIIIFQGDDSLTYETVILWCFFYKWEFGGIHHKFHFKYQGPEASWFKQQGRNEYFDFLNILSAWRWCK